MDFNDLINPRTYAIIGASQDPRSGAYRFIEALIENEYKVQPGDFESAMKSNCMWVLNSVGLISRLHEGLGRITYKCYDLINKIKYGSELGPLRTQKGIGATTIKRLNQNGFKTMGEFWKEIKRLRDLKTKDKDILIDLENRISSFGISSKKVEIIIKYISRRYKIAC